MKDLFTVQKSYKPSSKIDTVIGPSSNIQGNISSTATVRIDGNYEGDIVTDEDVIVGEKGIIKGNITAINVSLSGKVTGNVSCRGLLEILPLGVLDGDIEVCKISIIDGGTLRGKCSMIKEPLLDF